MTDSEILAIPAAEPERLYGSPNLNEAKATYRKLAFKYHPDRGGDSKLFQKVKELYECVERKIIDGTWELPGKAVFHSTTDCKKYSFDYLIKRVDEVCTTYIGHGFVAYATARENDELWKHAEHTLRNMHLPANDAGMRRQAEIVLPKFEASITTLDSHVLVLRKPATMLCLRDVLNHLGGALEAKHVAWMISRMLNTRCLLQYGAKLVHGDISPDTVFIDPAKHTAMLVGGWWFATPLNGLIKALPGRTMAAIGHTLDAKPVADEKVMGDLIRVTGRELLGDVLGSRLLLNKAIPPELVIWLRSPANGAHADYNDWIARLLASVYGAKRPFVKFELDAEDIYGPTITH